MRVSGDGRICEADAAQLLGYSAGHLKNMRVEAAPSDDFWWAAHSVLHRELALKPWQWPAFEYPDEPCPCPAFSHAAGKRRSDRAERPEAFALYHELQRALQASGAG